ILSDLNQNKRGRASVAPLAFVRNGHSEAGVDTDSQAGSQPDDFALDTAAIGSSIELNGAPLAAVAVVESEAPVRPLLERLLGMTRIVRDLEAATAAWRDTNGAFHYVTLAGELLSRHGVYTGGSLNGNGNGKAPASILGRK